MPKGAKPGENRFKGAQKALTRYRVSRLRDIVVPKLKTLASHATVDSINKFCSLAAEIYNQDLPVNEQPISYRRLNQSEQYWEIVGPVYYQYFEKKQKLNDFKKSSTTSLKNQRIDELEGQIDRLKAENKALRATLTHSPSDLVKEDSGALENAQVDIDRMARIIELMVSKSGVVEVFLDEVAMRDLAEDLEDPQGMLPREVVEPYIRWLKNKKAKLGER